MSPAQSTQNASAGELQRRFGTFGGVFTPSILTILGVIMFMRAGFVTGQAGIRDAILILLFAKSITLLTGLSIAAVATNTEVKGGGAYFLISRTLGPEFGGTIGLALYLAQTLSIPFYIIGFTEAVTATFQGLQPFTPYIMFFTAALLFAVVYTGASWAIKIQYGIMSILALSIITFMVGGWLHWDKATFLANMGNNYRAGGYSFWTLFAIYFPAVTGIMAGVNMSGDLKNPSRALPLGTLAAIFVGLIIYGLQIVIYGGAVERQTLIDAPYQSLLANSLWGMWVLVALGVVAATLSSALGSYLGSPRILQSLAQDRILKPLLFFGKLSRRGEPHRALILSSVITVLVLYYARGSAAGALNIVASLVTMLFLWTYGITNLAAFVESFGANPSFRPRFRFFHWSLALAGGVLCIFAAFLIDALAALVAVALIIGLFLYVQRFVLTASFGDARRGFFYSLTRSNLFRLARTPVHPKNWRPTILVLSGNPAHRLTLVKFADWLGGGRGLVILARILPGSFQELGDRRQTIIEDLEAFIAENKFLAFPEVLITPELELGLNQLLQATSIGPLKPNVAMFGWSDNTERAEAYVRNLRIARQLNMSLVLVVDKGTPPARQRRRRIDIWWRGKQNGSLMVILGHLMTLNQAWSGTTIRILRVVPETAQRDMASDALKMLIDSSRMTAETVVIDSTAPFSETLNRHSADANAVLLGFQIPPEERARQFQEFYSSLTANLPTTLLVYSSGEADLTS